ncbi:MAG: TauD/TfdA family dioxygenase [Acidimicrobiales bacterium]
MNIEVATTALSDHIGVEVRGVESGAFGDPLLSHTLHSLLGRHHLLLFRQRDMPVADQIAIMGQFGEVVDEGGNGLHHVFVSNAREDGVLTLGKRLVFHSDNVFTPDPLNVVSLYGLRVVDDTAPTRFANTVRACSLVTESMARDLADASALNLSGFAGGWYRYRDAEVEPHHPRAVHPVITRDTWSGDAALMVSEQQTDRILDWPADASETTLQALFALLYHPNNVYEHHWREGDLVIWDNLALQHGRPELISEGERTLRRVSAVRSNSTDQYAWTTVSQAAEAASSAAAPQRGGGFAARF